MTLNDIRDELRKLRAAAEHWDSRPLSTLDVKCYELALALLENVVELKEEVADLKSLLRDVSRGRTL